MNDEIRRAREKRLRAEVKRFRRALEAIGYGPHDINKDGQCSSRQLARTALTPRRKR